MAESIQDRIHRFTEELKKKVEKERNTPDFDALNHMASDKNTKLSRLPDFDELLRLKNLHPEKLYKQAVKLRVDRNEVEEKLLIPIRRVIAAMHQYHYAAVNGHSLLEYDDRPGDEVAEEALTEMLAQLMLVCQNILEYDMDPVSASMLDEDGFSELRKSIRNL